MTAVILVHGAWHGSWCWDKVAPILKANGLEVYAPCLSGTGERAIEAADSIGLETHIGEIAGLIGYSGLQDVLLVGHSLAGMIITGVADRMPGCLRGLIYIDAELPENGECALGELPISDHYAGLIAQFRIGPNQLAPLPVEFFGLPEGRLRDHQASMLKPHPEHVFTDPIRLSHPPTNGLPTLYILATDPPAEDGKFG
jgi:pimeloyl-ACP methyl ester carboxylesterase